jgi:hypothetical protein
MTIEVLSPVNKESALQKKEEIETLLGQINTHELRLASSYARLGSALRDVKVNSYWEAYGYDRFSSYLEFVWKTIGKKRSQVYAILSVSETLLPHIPESKLEEIGITKSYELKRLVDQGGRIDVEITDSKNQTEDCFGTVQLMDYAADPKTTAAMLRVKVSELLHQTEAPQGYWYDLGGFYANPDEKKEIEQFWTLGKQVLQITSESEHEIKKEVFLAAIRESYSTWVEMEHGQNSSR